ncbi:MAG TPA: hypothetical protein VER55_09420 [Ardenticatenaceae bacterium]|nr:hypothetical protein [Ardenticatenaceae bacterium]
MTIDGCLAGPGETAYFQGRPARAARLLAAASVVNEATGSRESLAR